MIFVARRSVGTFQGRQPDGGEGGFAALEEEAVHRGEVGQKEEEGSEAEVRGVELDGNVVGEVEQSDVGHHRGGEQRANCAGAAKRWSRPARTSAQPAAMR